MSIRGMDILRLAAALQCLLGLTAAADAATTIKFSLNDAYATSAGVFDDDGVLLRTLWSGQRYPAGTHTVTWDNRDDAGQPVSNRAVKVALIYHRVAYRWDGVIGNTSAAFTGSQVHHSMFPPTSMAISTDRALYAVGYNEGQTGGHGFALIDPQVDRYRLQQIDPFSAWSLVATDGRRNYWANTGGLSRTSFVAASDPATGTLTPFPAGKSICLAYNGSHCWPPQQYQSVIDIGQDARAAPTGLAVQPRGRLLAVAHGRLGTVRLFDKDSGAPVRSFSVPASSDSANQLASAPGGDLWVITGRTVVRYTRLDSPTPQPAATIEGLSRPLAVAVHPANEDWVLVADGGASQQVKAFDRNGKPLWSYGVAGGYTDPEVKPDKLWFYFDPTLERTALAVQADGSFWVVDTCNSRMLHISARREFIEQIAYLPATYSATVDPNDPKRVFANYLEYEVDQAQKLRPGPDSSWKLVRNWLGGLPRMARPAAARNGGNTGLRTVITLANDRTYALSTTNDRQVLLELPQSAPARYISALPPPGPGYSTPVLYENGELGFARTENGRQMVYRQALSGFTSTGEPIWDAREPFASVSSTSDVPTYKGAFSGATGARFPISSTDKVIFLDPSVEPAKAGAPSGWHLGALQLHGEEWLWKASPEGTIDQPGAFQTKAVDGTIHYGGNMLWAVGRHIIYGFHGEAFTDQSNGRVGQANQFMHFHDSGLYLGQFGIPSSRAPNESAAGVAGNAFSNILVADGPRLLFFHNDESQHGGVHRWTVENLTTLHELSGRGAVGATIVLSEQARLGAQPVRIKERAEEQTREKTEEKTKERTIQGADATRDFHVRADGRPAACAGSRATSGGTQGKWQLPCCSSGKPDASNFIPCR